MKKGFAAIAAGAAFGLGLSVSGMTEPRVVLAFLTVAAGWNPTLILVMASAVAVSAIGYLATNRRHAPLYESDFHPPERTEIDRRLLLGAVTFGIGWGLCGYCPGPALVGMITLDPRALAFIPGFVVGMLAYESLPSADTPQLDNA